MKEKMNENGYTFSELELTGSNPYNDNEGNPMPNLTERSYAWCQAAYNHRLSEKVDADATLDYNNFGS